MIFWLFQYVLSEKVATKIGASISTSLPEPQKYVFLDKNPILICLVDQTFQDPQWEGQLKSDQDLAREIIKALEEEIIQWPGSDLITESDWIANMKKGFLTFYRNCSVNPKQVEDFEYLLLDLASKFLNRKISLYPFNVSDVGSPKIFNSEGLVEYCLLGNTSIAGQNFFISLQRQPSEQEHKDQKRPRQRKKKERKCLFYYKTF